MYLGWKFDSVPLLSWFSIEFYWWKVPSDGICKTNPVKRIEEPCWMNENIFLGLLLSFNVLKRRRRCQVMNMLLFRFSHLKLSWLFRGETKRTFRNFVRPWHWPLNCCPQRNAFNEFLALFFLFEKMTESEVTRCQEKKRTNCCVSAVFPARNYSLTTSEFGAHWFCLIQAHHSMNWLQLSSTLSSLFLGIFKFSRQTQSAADSNEVGRYWNFELNSALDDYWSVAVPLIMGWERIPAEWQLVP